MGTVAGGFWRPSSRGEARLTDLAAELEVSVVTVRRDVEELAREGKVRRGHGVAKSLVRPKAARPIREADGGAVALVIPERHAYLNEAVHGARSALEESGMRVVLHIAPRVEGSAEHAIVERVLTDDVRGLLIAPRWRTAEAGRGGLRLDRRHSGAHRGDGTPAPIRTCHR